MSRFYGAIGFELDQRETAPGIYESSTVEERNYSGMLHKNFRKFESTANGVNDNMVLENRISIVCDNYMADNWPMIRYAVCNGVKWKVERAEIKRPRIFLTLGGVWNGHTA